MFSSLFHFVLRFWNQTFNCWVETPRKLKQEIESLFLNSNQIIVNISKNCKFYLANVFLSSLLMYFFSSKSFSSSYICQPLNDVLGFFLISSSSSLLMVDRLSGESGERMSVMKWRVRCPPWPLNWVNFSLANIQFGFYFIKEIVLRSLLETKSLWTSEPECEFEKTIHCNEMRAKRGLLGFNPEDFSLDIDISAIVLYLSFPLQGSFSGITTSQN